MRALLIVLCLVVAPVGALVWFVLRSREKAAAASVALPRPQGRPLSPALATGNAAGETSPRTSTTPAPRGEILNGAELPSAAEFAAAAGGPQAVGSYDYSATSGLAPIAAAASKVPVVGSLISGAVGTLGTVLNVAESLFGGGSATNASAAENKLINANAHGIVDLTPKRPTGSSPIFRIASA